MKRLVPLVALVLVLAACSEDVGDAGSTTTEGQPTTTESAAATTTTALATTSTTVVQTTVVTSVSTDPGDTSLDNPLELGRVVQVGDWRLRVASIQPDATDDIMAEYEYNDPPGDDEQFFQIGLEATYAGEDSGTFWTDITLKVVGESAVAYESFDASCGVISNDITNSGETFPGGINIGDACWNIKSSDADSLVLIVEDWTTFDDDRAFLSLDASAAPVDETTSIGLPDVVFDATPFGTPVEVGSWAITVTGVTPDDTETILEEHPFNDPPPTGMQFFVAHLEAEYVGSDSGSFWVDLTLKAVGESRVAYEPFGSDCGSITDDIYDTGETFPGGKIAGNVCWTVHTGDVPTLVMLAEESFGFDDDTRVFFSLTE